jgi:hypothetical protein
MIIFKVVTKKTKDQPFWNDGNLLIAASDYGAAADKAKNFVSDAEIVSIQVFGETTSKNDVFILRDR